MPHATPCLLAVLSQSVLRRVCVCVPFSVCMWCLSAQCGRMRARIHLELFACVHHTKQPMPVTCLAGVGDSPLGAIRRPVARKAFSRRGRCRGSIRVAGALEVHVVAVRGDPKFPWVPRGTVVNRDDDGDAPQPDLVRIHAGPALA